MVLAISYALNYNNFDNHHDSNNNHSNSISNSNSNSNFHASASQKRLAEITEMIHTASLFHDDVIDKVVLCVYIYI